LNHVLPVGLADRWMACRAGKVRMSPFELESRVTIVVESVDRPALCGAVTSLTVLLVVLLELAAVHVQMTRIAGDGRAPVYAGPMQWLAGRADPLLPVTIGAVSLLVGARQGVAGPASVIVGPDIERGGILPVTSRAVTFGHLSFELLSMWVSMALPALAGRGGKETDACSLSQDMATNARNRCVCPRERIDRCMLCNIVLCGQESFLLVTIGALCVAGEELPLVRVHMATIALTRHGNESAHSRIQVGRMAFDARHRGVRAS